MIRIDRAIALVALSFAGLTAPGKAVLAAGRFVAGGRASADGPFVPGKIIERVVCQADPNQSYALYIPLRGNKEPLPVLYFFDSHGVGALP